MPAAGDGTTGLHPNVEGITPVSLALVARCRKCHAVVGAAVFDGVDSLGWALDALGFLVEGHAVTMEDIHSFRQEECRCTATGQKGGPTITWNVADDVPGGGTQRLRLAAG